LLRPAVVDLNAGEGVAGNYSVFPGNVTNFGGHPSFEHGAAGRDFEGFDVPIGFAGDEGHDFDLHAVFSGVEDGLEGWR